MQSPVSRRTLLIAAGLAPAVAACKSSETSSKSKTSSTAKTTTTKPTTTAMASTTAATSTTAAATATTTPLTEGYLSLWVPPLLKGPNFDLDLAASTSVFFDGKTTNTIAFNGASMWGPTLEMQTGDVVTANITNKLSEDTTTHWHGIHLPAEMDGGPHQVIAPGATWKPTWTVKNNAATYWYHPHAHELTWKQMNQGAGGFIIVRDEKEAALDLPRTYGVDDFPVVFTSRAFGDDGQIDTERIYGDYLLANGVLQAEVAVPAQQVRFRILNAEIERAYTIGFGDDRKFAVIGTDGGLMDAPVTTDRLLVFPGERYEIVVDLTAEKVGATLKMMCYNTGKNSREYPGSEPAPPAGSGNTTFSSLLNDSDFEMLQLKVMTATSDAVKTLPAALVTTALWTADAATNERSITINGGTPPGTGPFYFDDGVYDMSRIDQRVKLGTTEAWTVQNTQIFSHSFHIHDVQFAILSRSTGEVPAYEKGWKDTVHIIPNEKVTFVAKFEDYASDEHPFMYHCHMSNHEDEGMMGQFLVTETG